MAASLGVSGLLCVAGCAAGSPVVVAVVDTGYYTAHPDLQGALWTNPDCATDADGDGRVGDCHGWNFTTNSADVDNGSYGTHGTSVAGVIAARAGNGEGSAGVAPGVQIMPLVIGSGENVDVYLGAEAIRYAADHGASGLPMHQCSCSGATPIWRRKCRYQTLPLAV